MCLIYRLQDEILTGKLESYYFNKYFLKAEEVNINIKSLGFKFLSF